MKEERGDKKVHTEIQFNRYRIRNQETKKKKNISAEYGRR